jgi:hypothetical protein
MLDGKMFNVFENVMIFKKKFLLFIEFILMIFMSIILIPFALICDSFVIV